MNFKLASGIAAAVFFASTVAPVFASTTIDVSGNGALSHQHVSVKNKQKTKVKQSNSTAVLNLTGVFQNTGGGDASYNTGGTVNQTSGDATSHVTNHTTTGGNSADIDLCGCQAGGDTDITVNDNGALSHQHVNVSNSSQTSVSQNNETFVLNGTLVEQNTGGLDANFNTGGNVTQTSGNADSTVNNTTTTGDNVVTVH